MATASGPIVPPLTIVCDVIVIVSKGDMMYIVTCVGGHTTHENHRRGRGDGQLGGRHGTARTGDTTGAGTRDSVGTTGPKSAQTGGAKDHRGEGGITDRGEAKMSPLRFILPLLLAIPSMAQNVLPEAPTSQ